MRTKTETLYILNDMEKLAYDKYMGVLKAHPLPCHDCDAITKGKCIGHSLWEGEVEGEDCKSYNKWISDTEAERTYCVNMPMELKGLFEKQYAVQVYDNKTNDLELARAMAHRKLAEAKNVEKVSYEYVKNSSFSNLWEENI